MNRTYCKVDAFYRPMGREMNGVLYTPREDIRDTAVVVIHSDADYLNFTALTASMASFTLGSRFSSGSEGCSTLAHRVKKPRRARFFPAVKFR